MPDSFEDGITNQPAEANQSNPTVILAHHSTLAHNSTPVPPPMRVEVSLLPPVTDPRTKPVDLAIVIDVLRATSVMATALHHGSREIVTCRTVEEAKSLADVRSAKNTRPLLCGERECRPIDEFDLGNSPSEYGESIVAGRSLVLTTTNGTAAIAAAASANRLLAAAFVNLSATVAAIGAADSIHIICAGTNGRITGEDVLCAGALLDRLLTKRDPCRSAVELVGDESKIALDHWLGEGWRDNSWRVGDCRASGSLARRLAESQGGRNLAAVGYSDDIETCALTDAKPAVVTRVNQKGEGGNNVVRAKKGKGVITPCDPAVAFATRWRMG